MATYITLVKYTAQGIKAIKDSPKRVDAFRQLCKSMGAELKGFYLTMGRCDLVVIVDAPDDATVAKLILAVSSQGNVSSETLRAFSEAEFKQIVAGLP
jgi:uncharacterized protein with GYD domain